MIGLRTLASAFAMALPAAAIAATPIAMHCDPGCGCCEKWAAQVRAQFGRHVQIIDDATQAAFETVPRSSKRRISSN
jgi:hypothetical protein